MKRLLITGVGSLALIFAMVGCEGTGTTEVTGPKINSITAEVISDEDCMNVRVDLSVSEFEVVDTIGGDATDGAQGDGYYVYYLDRIPVSLQEEVPQLLAPGETPLPGEQSVAWVNSNFTWKCVGQGVRIFAVQLVDADGTPLVPAVVAAAAINVPAMVVSEEEEDIVVSVVDDGRFTTLVEALQAAELVDTLKGTGPFTVFAPTDAAFDALPAGTLDALLDDIPALTDTLLYHVVPEKLMAADLMDMTSVETVSGATLAISVTNGDVMVNDSQVIEPDIEVSNGVIHIIDTVLIPPEEDETSEAMSTTISLSVDDTGYDLRRITVLEAGQEVTITLQNNGQTAHGFTVYESLDMTTTIFVGDVIEAGESITYTFTAPSEPGIYYFWDDENPRLTGTYVFVVEESP